MHTRRYVASSCSLCDSRDNLNETFIRHSRELVFTVNLHSIVLSAFHFRFRLLRRRCSWQYFRYRCSSGCGDRLVTSTALRFCNDLFSLRNVRLFQTAKIAITTATGTTRAFLTDNIRILSRPIASGSVIAYNDMSSRDASAIDDTIAVAGATTHRACGRPRHLHAKTFSSSVCQ